MLTLEEQDGRNKPKGKTSFQLCFALTSELGRSPLVRRTGTTICGKLNARHEVYPVTARDEKFESMLLAARDQGPRDRLEVPLLESQSCGWHHEPLIEPHRWDRRLYFPLQSSDVTRIPGAKTPTKR